MCLCYLYGEDFCFRRRFCFYCPTIGYHQPPSSFSFPCHAILLSTNCLFHKCKMSFSGVNLTSLRPRSFPFPMSLASHTSVTLKIKMKARRMVHKGPQSQASSCIILSVSLPRLQVSQVYHTPKAWNILSSAPLLRFI